MDKSAVKDHSSMYPSKKCPECYTYAPLESRICPSCKARLGKVDKHGMASRTTNWKANIICIIAWLIFAIFVKYAFF